MLGKLLKHEFIALGKKLLPVYMIILGLSLFTRLGMFAGEKIAILGITSTFAGALCVIAVIALPFVAFIFSIRRFYIHLFKAEGYLTNSLPVSRRNLVHSKIIVAIVYFLLGCVVMMGSLTIMYYDQELVAGIKSIFEATKDYSIPIIATLIISYISTYLFIIAAYCIGQTKNGNKITNAVIAGLIIYAINQAISFVMLLGIGFFENDIFNQLENNVPEAIKYILWFSVGLSVLITVLYYITTIISLNKKMDIE